MRRHTHPITSYVVNSSVNELQRIISSIHTVDRLCVYARRGNDCLGVFCACKCNVLAVLIQRDQSAGTTHGETTSPPYAVEQCASFIIITAAVARGNARIELASAFV